MAEMDSVEAQVTEEVRRIIAVVGELAALPSRWSGKVELVPNANFRGKKRFSCDIQIDASLAIQSQRWPTLIHEVFHCFSAGYNREDYQKFRGWEEGTVEQLQRLLRAEILRRIGADVDLLTLIERDTGHYYNPYVESLEVLRQALFISDMPNNKISFFLDLLGIPIRARSGYILGRGFERQQTERAQFIALFSKANAVLTRSRL